MPFLYLGSKSSSRRMLLDLAQIPYQVVAQDADETECDWTQPLQMVVESIALYKMKHAFIPPGTKEGEIAFILTADTLSEDKQGKISGKPVDRADAIAKIKAARTGIRTGTAFCIEKRLWDGKKWQQKERILEFVDARYSFVVPDEWIDTYLEKSCGLKGTQAIAVEEYGAQFLQKVEGSYTAIVGLPLYEVRQALERLQFFEQSV